jgi:hypothetical protein
MVTVLPERSLAPFALVVLLGRCGRRLLLALSYDVGSRVVDQEMNVIGCHRIIEDSQTQAFLGLETPMQVTATVTRKLQ